MIMGPTNDTSAAGMFAAKCDHARSELRRHMADRGLLEKDGWTIHESMRQANGGTVLVMRPIHMKLPAPDLECSCSIDEEGNVISSDCNL
jgi:hypothetical protein